MPDPRFAQQALEKLLSTPKNAIDLGDLASEIVEAFGGNKGIAQHIFARYSDSQTSGMQKNQLLKLAASIVERQAVLTKDDSRPEQQMSTEDLKEELERTLAKMQQQPLHAAAASRPPAPDASGPEPFFGDRVLDVRGDHS